MKAQKTETGWVRPDHQAEGAEKVPEMYDAAGMLTRAGALAQARMKLGEMATISSDEDLPRLVWSVGQFGYTVGRGRTWEQALQRSREPRKEKRDVS